MVNVLQVILRTGDGFSGVDAFVKSFCLHMQNPELHFDFLFMRNDTLGEDAHEIFKDSAFYPIGALRENYAKLDDYYAYIEGQFSKHLDEHQYGVIHIHSASPRESYIFLKVAKEHNVKKVFVHSHAAMVEENALKKVAKKLVYSKWYRYIVKHADRMFACSQMAGIFMYGKKGICSLKYLIFHNAIELSKYEYNQEVRSQVRKQLGIDSNAIVFGAVGRISGDKNPIFIEDIFKAYHDLNANACLLMVGDGDLREDCEDHAKAIGVEDKILFLGQRSDVNELVQAMDALLFPSIFEGLSIVAIEAQAAGLPVYSSDTISPEHKILDSYQFISLDKSAEEWAKIISENLDTTQRGNTKQIIQAAGYDIDIEAEKLEGYYLE